MQYKMQYKIVFIIEDMYFTPWRRLDLKKKLNLKYLYLIIKNVSAPWNNLCSLHKLFTWLLRRATRPILRVNNIFL